MEQFPTDVLTSFCRWSELLSRDWLTLSRDEVTWESVNSSSWEAFSSAGHQPGQMVLRLVRRFYIVYTCLFQVPEEQVSKQTRTSATLWREPQPSTSCHSLPTGRVSNSVLLGEREIHMDKNVWDITRRFHSLFHPRNLNLRSLIWLLTIDWSKEGTLTQLVQIL